MGRNGILLPAYFIRERLEASRWKSARDYDVPGLFSIRCALRARFVRLLKQSPLIYYPRCTSDGLETRDDPATRTKREEHDETVVLYLECRKKCCGRNEANPPLFSRVLFALQECGTKPERPRQLRNANGSIPVPLSLSLSLSLFSPR